MSIYLGRRCWSVRRQEIGLCLEQLRRVLVSGVSARIMQHEGIRRLRYSLARKSATPGTFHRETQSGRVPYLIARRFMSSYLEASKLSQKIVARFWSQLVWIFLRSVISLYIIYWIVPIIDNTTLIAYIILHVIFITDKTNKNSVEFATDYRTEKWTKSKEDNSSFSNLILFRSMKYSVSTDNFQGLPPEAIPAFLQNLQNSAGYNIAKPIARPAAYHPYHRPSHQPPQRHLPPNAHHTLQQLFYRGPYLTGKKLA